MRTSDACQIMDILFGDYAEWERNVWHERCIVRALAAMYGGSRGKTKRLIAKRHRRLATLYAWRRVQLTRQQRIDRFVNLMIEDTGE